MFPVSLLKVVPSAFDSAWPAVPRFGFGADHELAPRRAREVVAGATYLAEVHMFLDPFAVSSLAAVTDVSASLFVPLRIRRVKRALVIFFVIVLVRAG